jgi:hypothetical protein
MSEGEWIADSQIEDIDPNKAQDATKSGELERPRPRRKIDCAGNPEIADRRHAARGSSDSRKPN